jgi:hypothetical protein
LPKFCSKKSDKIVLKEIHWRQTTQIDGALIKPTLQFVKKKKRKKEKKIKEKRLIISSKLLGQCWAVIRNRNRDPAVVKAQFS